MDELRKLLKYERESDYGVQKLHSRVQEMIWCEKLTQDFIFRAM
jgi:hypothetical protein